MGHFAIQIDSANGAHVITTCSTKNRDLVHKLGANTHIARRTQAFEEELWDIGFVFDTQGF